MSERMEPSERQRLVDCYLGIIAEIRQERDALKARLAEAWSPAPPTMRQSIASEVVALVDQKQAAYGDSFGKSGEVLRLMCPNGIPPERFDDALAVVRVLDKLFRIMTAPDAFGEDPWLDVNGYSLLAAERRRAKR